MSDRKSKRETEGTGVEQEEMNFVMEPTNIEVGSGYTLAVSYDEDERPVIDVKTYGEVNTAKLRKELSKVFPNAEIRKLNQIRSVTLIKADKQTVKRKKSGRHRLE